MELAQGITQAVVDWHAISPELVLTVAACMVLVADLFLPDDVKWVAMPLSAAGLLGTLAAVVSLIGEERITLAGSFEVDAFSLLFKALFCIIGLVLLAISFHFFRSGRYYQGEYYFLLLSSLLGGLVIASSRDLISIFIAIELISIPGFVMTGLRKRDPKSNEGALEFFLFGVLSTASKIGGFVGLLVLMFKGFPDVADSWRPAFAVLATLTMTVGNFIALRQTHIIRLLAYSGIAQSGYILVGFALIDPSNVEASRQAFQSAVIYLAIYGVMDLGAFAAAVAFARRGGSYFINDYSGLWQRSPALAPLLAGFLVSLAGAPPMAGAWAKLFVFLAAINAEVYWLAVVMGVNAVVAAWYYLAVVKRMFFDAPEVTEPVEVPSLFRVALGVTTLALIVAFIYPPIITELAERTTFF